MGMVKRVFVKMLNECVAFEKFSLKVWQRRTAVNALSYGTEPG
jgi:hypothetical protein